MFCCLSLSTEKEKNSFIKQSSFFIFPVQAIMFLKLSSFGSTENCAIDAYPDCGSDFQNVKVQKSNPAFGALQKAGLY